jgi:hypothetical protein
MLQVKIGEIPAAAGAAAIPTVPMELIKDYGWMNRNQLVDLTAHGETIHDLLNHLVKAYARVECEESKKEFEEKKSPTASQKTKTTPAKKLTFAESVIAAMEDDDLEEGQADLENEA